MRTTITHVQPARCHHRTFCTRVATDQHRAYLDLLGRQLGVQKLDDWYHINKTQMIKTSKKSAELLKRYGSVHQMLVSVYKEHNWAVWKFHIVDKRIWNDINAQKQFMDELAKKIGVTSLDDWYKWNAIQLRPYGSRRLLDRCYAGNLYKALCTVYPEHPWKSWRFPKVVDLEDWKNTDKLKEYIEWVGNDIGIKKLDDWYDIGTKDLLKRNGRGVLTVYKDSVYNILKQVHPEHPWKEWKFHRVSKFFWNDQSNLKRFFADAADALGIQTMEDWYRISQEQLSSLGGGGLITQHQGISNLLIASFPDYPWDRRKLGNINSPKRAGQRQLALQLQRLFPNQAVYEDYQHPEIRYPDTNDPLQLDVFLPNLKLGFEYQGQQHFHDVPHFQPQKVYERRDALKRILCQQHAISLVEVPYSWKKEEASLMGLVREVRPDIVPSRNE